MAPLIRLAFRLFLTLAFVIPILSAPTTGTQIILQAGQDGPAPASQRKLHGKFLHITDLHPDKHYETHSSTNSDKVCHRGYGPAGVYGAETSDCDSPLTLVNSTLSWIKENLKDSIDFVIWTGDSARHDNDEKHPRKNKDILAMNRRIAGAMVNTFSDDKGLEIPIVPTFGNNDVFPHNVLKPGPNDILRTYSDIWSDFIPATQRHSFEFGGWFYTEVVPDQLAVFSLNTMYFFDRNAAIDDCASPSEPGYKHLEWLDVQLDYMRHRGMKAILIGHVPPARTSGKTLWDETCWQKYTLWLNQYRDVVVGSMYGHMNIDHFMLQDTKEVNIAGLLGKGAKGITAGEEINATMSIQSSSDYLKELRDDWAKLPNPVILDDKGVDESGKKKHRKDKKKKKLGGKWAERYQLSLVSPSIVPNYFPTLRVVEYNITGIEDSPTWVDTMRASNDDGEVADQRLELRSEPETDFDTELDTELNAELEILKKKKGKKGKKPHKPHDPPELSIPSPPPKKNLPGPAYAPQTLTLMGYTQYFANLTYLNNDFTADQADEDNVTPAGWDAGQHKDEKPKHRKPQPREFAFEVEYDTFTDKVYKLKDLTVKSYLHLAHRIGTASKKSKALDFVDTDDEDEDNEDIEVDDNELEEIDTDEEDLDDDNESDDEYDADMKKGKKDKKKKKRKAAKKTWFHFLNHAFVSTRTKKELKKLAY
ncbi:Metallo-dependent phosphatase-like protein [Xylariomycetidae sp. FL0641]|nr:Metallo-dependent phosphatase-like protein [Xylariomycetidae sp. FL0641]